MISYCVICYRPVYCKLLLPDLIRKTTARPYEICLWLNTDDSSLEALIAEIAASGVDIRVIGRTPQNIGGRCCRKLYESARYDMIVQIDDDVLCLSRYIAEKAKAIFDTHPRVKQLVADVYQDAWTSGARPPMKEYRDLGSGLWEGPIDGWFCVFTKDVLPFLVPYPDSLYWPMGSTLRSRLKKKGLQGALCTHFKVFHAVDPYYPWYFGRYSEEVKKYQSLEGIPTAPYIPAVLKQYADAFKKMPPRSVLDDAYHKAIHDVSSYGVIA